MEPSETIKNRRAPGIHQPPPSPPRDPGAVGKPGWDPRSEPVPEPSSQVPMLDTSSACCLRVPTRSCLALLLPARACTLPRQHAAGREGCRRRMQARSPRSRRREAPAPAPAQLGTGLPAPCPVTLCRDAGLLPASPHGWASQGQTPAVPSRWDLLRRKDVPVTLLAKTHCTEGNPDLQKPAASPWVLRTPHSSPHA